MKLIQVKVPDTLHLRLKLLAVKTGKSIQEIVTEQIQKWVEEKEAEENHER